MSRSKGADVSLPDGDDLLWEILLRLPPQPSSLPSASAVCKRWRRLTTDPRFLHGFYAHHQKPPLLGVFEYRDSIMFTPVLDAPNRIPRERFDLGCYSCRRDDGAPGGPLYNNHILGCRHGRVLIVDHVRTKLVVCTPITGEQCPVAIPPEFKTALHRVNGAVLCAADDQGHVHGGCHTSPFKVVLVSMYRKSNQPLACVYFSKTGSWGNLVSTAAPCVIFNAHRPGSLVGNALYWLATGRNMLEFDFKEQSLAVISGPPVGDRFGDSQIIQAEDGIVGFAILSYRRFQMWQRNINVQGVATWVLSKTIEINNILGLPPKVEGGSRWVETILGYSEDTDVIFIYVDDNVYMVQLKSMQSKRLHHEIGYIFEYHPLTGFYSPGITIAGGCDGAEVLHDAL